MGFPQHTPPHQTPARPEGRGLYPQGLSLKKILLLSAVCFQGRSPGEIIGCVLKMLRENLGCVRYQSYLEQEIPENA